MCGGGGGQTNSVSEFKAPAWTQAGWQAYVDKATALQDVPYKQSGLAGVAPTNAVMDTAQKMAIDRAMNGAPDLNAARSMAMNMSNGSYRNMWADNVAGIASGAAYNPYGEGISAMAQGQANPYISDEYVNTMIGNTANDMANAYATGSAAQSAAAANMSGNFGSGGQQAVDNAGQQGLEKQVGQMAAGMRQQHQQYAGSQYQADLARQMQALGLGTQSYNQDVGNQMQATQLGGGLHAGDINAMLQGGGLAGNLAQDDYASIKMLSGVGNDQRAYQQQLLDYINQQWGNQNQYDMAQNEAFGNALTRASGGQGSTTQINNGSAYSPLMGLAGMGLAAYGAFR